MDTVMTLSNKKPLIYWRMELQTYKNPKQVRGKWFKKTLYNTITSLF